MSRSRRKTPITPVTTSTSEAWDKKAWNRRFRHGERMRVQRDHEALPLDRNFYGTTWNFAKDGKHYRENASPKMMRK